jgi:hypothetical protein
MAENQTEKEKLPVDENLNVMEYTTIYRTNKWWCVVAFVNAWGHDKVMVYLWQWKEKKKLEAGEWIGSGQFSWRVQQKMGINFENNWEAIKKAVDSYMPRMRSVQA